MSKWHAQAPSGATHVVINTEWGNLNVASLPRLAADAVVDERSPNPGQQTFEKLIAGMYLGRIATLTLLHMDGEATLFTDDQRQRLQSEPGALSTPLLSRVENDTSEGLSTARQELASALGSPLTDTALAAVKEVCHLVTRRAARLSAAAIVGVLEHCGAGGEALQSPTVAVDGGLFEHHAAFAAMLAEAVAEMGVKATLRLTPDGSGVGAALLAAAAESRST